MVSISGNLNMAKHGMICAWSTTFPSVLCIIWQRLEQAEKKILTLSMSCFTLCQQLSSALREMLSCMSFFSCTAKDPNPLLQPMILDQACWYLDEGSFHEEFESTFIILIHVSPNMSSPAQKVLKLLWTTKHKKTEKLYFSFLSLRNTKGIYVFLSWLYRSHRFPFCSYWTLHIVLWSAIPLVT